MKYAGPTTIAMAGALTIALTACSGSGGTSTSGKPVEGGTFTLAISADPGTLDPHATALSVAHQVGAFLYDSLVAVDASGKEVPALAGTWKSTATTASYTLRKGITCSDGTPLTATDVADNINYVADPKNGSSAIGLYVPPGAKAKADDSAGTVTVTSPVPDAFLGRNVGGLPIVCRGGMKDRSILKQGGSGTGMFTLTEAVADDHYSFTRRKDYAWGPGGGTKGARGLPDTVVLQVVPNEATAANLLLVNQVNAAVITGQDRKRVAERLDFQRSMHAPLGELWFNQRRGAPTADAGVRRALTQALDLKELRTVVTNGGGEPPTGLVAKGQGPCTADTVEGNLPDHDRAAAERALDAAGWKPGTDGVRQKDGKRLSLTFYYPTSRGIPMQNAAELLRSSWQKVGVKVSLRGAADAQFDQVISGEGSWDALFLPLTVTLPTQAVPFLSGPTPPDGNNFGSVDNAAYEAHVEAASALPGAKGCDEWAAAEKALFQQADVVPFADLVTPVFGNRATFELADGSIVPTSIRMVG
ncbi:ABC transporter substrate-binding protein [Streptomyces marokkonensis]|uniref:ABC transporter substrate-binding protein n=1 Tax=Streptomyces marokkonensis TaxID=324855 RepID=A0ABW6QG03_9ACTN